MLLPLNNQSSTDDELKDPTFDMPAHAYTSSDEFESSGDDREGNAL